MTASAHPPRGIIIEGVSGIGKTSVIRRLRATLASQRPGSTALFLSEHYTERVLETQRAAGKLSYDDVMHHVESKLMPLIEATARLQSESSFAAQAGNSMIRILLERWVGGMFANLAADGIPFSDSYNSRVVDNLRRLSELGILTVVLEVDHSHIDTLIRSTRCHRNEAWSTYLDRIDRASGLNAYFHNWQRFLQTHYRAIPGATFIKVKPPFVETQYDAIAAELYRMIDPAK